MSSSVAPTGPAEPATTEPPSTRRFTLLEFTLFLAVIAATTAVFSVAAEFTARWLFPEQLIDSCAGGPGLIGHKPDCSMRLKAAEGSWVQFHFNDCGYRGPPCRPAAPPASRLVVLGSSTSFGYLVPYEDTWSNEAAATLARGCTEPIDVQNIGGEGAWGDLNVTVARASEIRTLHPSLVALVITPFDLFVMQPEGTDAMTIIRSAMQGAATTKRSAIERLRVILKDSRAAEIAQHYMFGDPKVYVSSYLLLGDKADYLRSPLTERWRERMSQLDHAVHAIAREAGAVSAPFYLVVAPTEAQAEMLADPSLQRSRLDPSLFGREVAAIAARNHVHFVDGIGPFASVKNPQNDFYRSEGHINALGHSVLAHAMVSAVRSNGDTNRLCGDGR